MLDSKLREAVQKALERILYERPLVDTLVVELAYVQRDQLNKMLNLTGVDDDSLAQTIFDGGFEPMADMGRLIKDQIICKLGPGGILPGLFYVHPAETAYCPLTAQLPLTGVIKQPWLVFLLDLKFEVTGKNIVFSAHLYA